MTSEPTPVGELSKSKVTKAGKRLGDFVRSGGDVGAIEPTHELWSDLTIAQHWRASFADPLGHTSQGLRSFLTTCEIDGAPTQRHKKLERIISKLARPNPTKLAGMQDIGGVRVVVRSLAELRSLEKHIRWKWQEGTNWPEAAIVEKHCRDYVASPQESGYRAVHLIVRRKDRLVEIQLRSHAQQIWADQVEQVGRLIGCELKSEPGPPNVEEFFREWGDLVGLTDEGKDVEATLRLDLSSHGYDGFLEVRYG